MVRPYLSRPWVWRTTSFPDVAQTDAFRRLDCHSFVMIGKPVSDSAPPSVPSLHFVML